MNNQNVKAVLPLYDLELNNKQIKNHALHNATSSNIISTIIELVSLK